METWPNFIIVGAQKAGTTALYDYLNQQPKVFMSKLKEPGYFRSFIPPNVFPLPITNKEKYLKLFQDVKNETAIGEASGVYLEDQGTPKLIRDSVPNCKIIIMLRDPVERTFSTYFQVVRSGLENESFKDAIRRDYKKLQNGQRGSPLVRASFYSEKIKRYLDTFESKNVMIIISEEFFKDVKGTIREVLKFLGINEFHDFDESPKNIYQETKSPIIQKLLENKVIKKIGYGLIPWHIRVKIAEKILWKEGKKPSISKEDREFLEKIFFNDLIQTQEILGMKLPWFVNKNFG